ncbi:MAG TPA: site-specific integrase, partial [Ferruginibacter sp.]|nr:site-specific integrase [Ferruginibacter sp.]
KGTFVRSWLAELKSAGMESKSINRKISALKSFFKIPSPGRNDLHYAHGRHYFSQSKKATAAVCRQ